MLYVLYWVEGEQVLELLVIPESLQGEGMASGIVDKVRLSLERGRERMEEDEGERESEVEKERRGRKEGQGELK